MNVKSSRCDGECCQTSLSDVLGSIPHKVGIIRQEVNCDFLDALCFAAKCLETELAAGTMTIERAGECRAMLTAMLKDLEQRLPDVGGVDVYGYVHIGGEVRPPLPVGIQTMQNPFAAGKDRGW